MDRCAHLTDLLSTGTARTAASAVGLAEEDVGHLAKPGGIRIAKRLMVVIRNLETMHD